MQTEQSKETVVVIGGTAPIKIVIAPSGATAYAKADETAIIPDDSICHFEVIEGEEYRVYSGTYDAERQVFIVARYGAGFDLIPVSEVNRYKIISDELLT